MEWIYSMLTAKETSMEDEGYVSKKGMTFTTRISLLFGLVAIMTALIAAGILAMVWEEHFTNYNISNMQRIATSTASSIAQRYGIYGSWSTNVLSQAASASEISGNIGIKVVDANGNIVYDDSWDVAESTGTVSHAINSEDTVQAAIIVNDQKIGTVYIWALESNALLTQNDQDFRTNSYQAIVIATVVAVLLATIIGFIVSRGLLGPIRRITKVASQLKEGNLGARTDLVGNDEIAQLGMTFDAMAESLQKDRELEYRLTSDVAHELRTPLMAIQSTVEAIIDGVLPADEQRLAVLNSEVIRLSHLVDALLKLSRLENRSAPMAHKEVDLGETIHELALSHEMLVEEAELKLTYSYDGGVIVVGDPELLRQAAANVLSNAVRYTPAGGCIDISVRRGQIMGKIIIKDTGIGMSEEDLKHVFSRFWRADAGRNRATGGLGIGLAIVKEIVDRHQGWVNVESVLGEGTTFTLYIPLIERLKKTSKSTGGKQGGLRSHGSTKERNAQKSKNKEYVAQRSSAREWAGNTDDDRAWDDDMEEQ
jgi:two-component system, OmpR family, sensor histidine kinase BaeS